jgi:hypothetical protein
LSSAAFTPLCSQPKYSSTVPDIDAIVLGEGEDQVVALALLRTRTLLGYKYLNLELFFGAEAHRKDIREAIFSQTPMPLSILSIN